MSADESNEAQPVAAAARPDKTRSELRRWAFALVPLVGLWELAAHVWQTHSVVPERDWLAARDAVTAIAKPDDLVVFAPRWTDPLARRYFGDEIATLEREARPDETRFPRAIEVSIRGEHAPALEGWREVASQRVGAVTLRTLANPAPAVLADYLLRHASPEGMHVYRVANDREQECAWSRGAPQTGNLGFGPAIPGDKFNCPGGGFVGVSIIADLQYWPRQCFYAPPSGGGATTRIRFQNVSFGRVLHGHHGLYVEAERHREGTPVSITFRAGDEAIGHAVHNDGDGWKPFEFPTGGLTGTKGELVVDISSASGMRRVYCFEADTR